MTVENVSSLDGKVAVLTGASRGLGKACADALIENGAKVVIGDVLEKEGLAVVEEYNAKYVTFFEAKQFKLTD
jgi:NAD(P)-dependent dehydrogenase (short-subunit alcohol dehydrogenase family)